MSKTIYIAGLGLIGGSLALAIRKAHPTYRILGYNRPEKSQQIARERGMVNDLTDDFASFAPLADIIILAVPIKQTILFLKELAQLDLKKGVIITDVGSTKQEIVAVAEVCFANREIDFIGGHPMAGSHKSGAIAADVSLFENAYYIFTPTQFTQERALTSLKDLFKGTGARYIEVAADEHDRVTSQISHFPHILATSLMLQTGDYAESHEHTKYFTAGGFRDMTRIAESEPDLWTSILLSNSRAVLDRIEEFKERLDEVAQLIFQKNEPAIWKFFNQGRAMRQAMEIHKKGGVDSFYDLFVEVPDEEDVVLKILELLRGISLVNLHINEENREDSHGVLQLTFKNAQDLATAEVIIKNNTDYHITIT
ncbi:MULTISPECIES: prephenate dehydrogenase [Streptococcus]|uniref:Prephenate dehydrogenase n=1 Tax=Streptococcus caledonicus TaxID=2614158 RepID=A0ABW0UE92_9STRE|nr:prephenate dehydrogenase [Streptococcus sp. S784/96/1]